MIDPALSHTFAATVAAVLGLAASHKLRAPLEFEGALAAYRILPGVLVPGIARALPIVEAAVALLLLVPTTRPFGAAGALALFGTYTAAIAINLARGRTDIDCGCAGPGQATPLSRWLVVRNVALAGLALAALLPLSLRSLNWLDFLTAAAATGALIMLFEAAEQLLSNRGRLAALRHYG